MPPKNAIITGSASGLGRAIALRLARDGWRIAVCDLNSERSAETARLIEQAGGVAQVESLDVTSADAWQALAERLRGDWGQLDLLVNNAGVAGAGNVGEFPLDAWRWMVGVNMWGVVHGCHTMVNWLKANHPGANIINTASAASFGTPPTMAAYNVTKAAVVALSETLYAELLPHGVGVTVLCPSFFQTNLLDGARFTDQRSLKAAQVHLRKATLTADAVADAAVDAMQRKRLYVVVPGETWRYWLLKRFAPMYYLRKVSVLINRAAGE
ncbi:MAG: SDR family NAD(P)-dependent oxidoreductase [Planctomycetales bacterium]|nr:SDR family NAD(P)-dependent oxidoreductase [Planctomycetales bacterium]